MGVMQTSARALLRSLPIWCLTVIGSGCTHYAATARLDEAGLVWMLPGIEGGPASLSGCVRGLRKAGVTAELYVYNWDRLFGGGGLPNLTEHQRNRRKALSIARRISAFHAHHPNTAIDLVGYSGGGGMAIMVAEALPQNVRLRNIVLCQAAIHPRYNLTRALRRVDGQLMNYYCKSDWLILGLGTSLFGTMDRHRGASAGMRGFEIDQVVSLPKLRAKIVQRGWDSSMVRDGHPGNHFGMLSSRWNMRYVAPYLLPDADARPHERAAPAERRGQRVAATID